MENVTAPTEPLPFLCPFCSAPFTLKMSQQWDIAEWCGDTEHGFHSEARSVTVDIKCDECGRLVYRKELQVPN